MALKVQDGHQASLRSAGSGGELVLEEALIEGTYTRDSTIRDNEMFPIPQFPPRSV